MTFEEFVDKFADHVIQETTSTYGAATESNIDKYLDRYCCPLSPSEYIKVMMAIQKKLFSSFDRQL